MIKFTFFFAILFSVASFAQIEINERLDDVSNNQVLAGRTNSGTAAASGVASNFTCDGSAKVLNNGCTAA